VEASFADTHRFPGPSKLKITYLKTQNFATSLACRKTGIGLQGARRIGYGVTGIVEAHCGLVQFVAAPFAGPDETVQFFRRAFSFDYEGPGAIAATRGMGSISGQEKNFPGFEQSKPFSFLRVDVVEIEFAFELIEHLISGIDVKIFAPVRPARHESDEIRVFPDDPALPPVATVVIDPLPEIETGEVRKHRASFEGEKESISAIVQIVQAVQNVPTVNAG
jgi:hypothetical protein